MDGVGKRLQQQGYDVERASQVKSLSDPEHKNLDTVKDSEILQYAKISDRTIITGDKDYERLLGDKGISDQSVVRIIKNREDGGSQDVNLQTAALRRDLPAIETDVEQKGPGYAEIRTDQTPRIQTLPLKGQDRADSTQYDFRRGKQGQQSPMRNEGSTAEAEYKFQPQPKLPETGRGAR